MMDLKAIRAEIEALKRKEGSINSDDWNEAIDNALAIIDSHINPKPEPNEAGIWQCVKGDARHQVYVELMADGTLDYPDYCKGSQWTKVQKI